MKADAPGKLVLSGAYAVLRGAPAIVTAVDRRVYADSDRPPDYRAPEVLAGLQILKRDVPPPWYDASALRDSGDKLGLGSSAAICVASLGAILAKADPAATPDCSALRERIYPLARQAHRQAQGGGSGVDVAAACFGGTLIATLNEDELTAPAQTQSVDLPQNMVWEVWASGHSASTAGMVGKVFAQEKLQKSQFEAHMGRQAEASLEAAQAAQLGSADAVILALKKQKLALAQLGRLATVDIILPQSGRLDALLSESSCLLPSGAGGGDVNLYVGLEPSPSGFREEAAQLGLTPVALSLAAPGLQIHPSGG